MRVLLVSPFGAKVNPYLGLLRDGLSATGALVSQARLLTPECLTGPERPDVIHLHWIEGYGRPGLLQPEQTARAASALERPLARLSAAGPVVDLRRWARLSALFDLLRRHRQEGGTVVYTAHNLDPHEAGSWPERRALRRIIRTADVVHVHDRATASELVARFARRNGVVVIPHGHYLTAYPNAINRAEARARLELAPDAFVYACLGLLRPYKGLEELVPAFRAAAGADARLLIAGKAQDADYVGRVAGLADGDARIRIEPRFVPGEELQLYFNAADIVVLPYRQITTSGAAMLAFSFGAPIVAPAIGAFPELVAPERGILYGPGGLPDALRDAQARDWTAARPAIQGWVKQFDWEEIGRRLRVAYTRPR